MKICYVKFTITIFYLLLFYKRDFVDIVCLSPILLRNIITCLYAGLPLGKHCDNYYAFKHA